MPRRNLPMTIFNREVGFACYQTIVAQLRQLKQTYRQVFIMGFSVGATIAWRCSETPWCDGIIGCYGSRIRDYLELQPACPVLLLFAEQDLRRQVGQISEKDEGAGLSISGQAWLS